jgi:Transposase DDE domain
MLSMTQALERIQGRITETVPEDLLVRLCRAAGHRWRERDLSPVVTTYLFLQQILDGNPAVGELRRRAHLQVSEGAYCRARARLPRSVLEQLQRAVTDQLHARAPRGATPRWHGHRTFLLDGSSFSMPDTPALQAHFGQPVGQAAGCGFPVAHLLARFDGLTGFLLEAQAQPLHTSDLSGVPTLHAALHRGDVLVGDRAFGSYAHLALCRQRGVHGVFRAHQKQLIDFRPHRRCATPQTRTQGLKGLPSSRWLKRLATHDQLVEYVKPKECPAWLSAADYARLPPTLTVREVRYTVRERGRRTRVVTLVTTLLDPVKYPASELARLYQLRWRVETNLRHLKQTLGLDVLRCRSVEGVLKELAVFVLIYNLVRRIMCEAARQQQVDPDRVSFIDAWRWLRHARPGDDLPELRINPQRSGRVEPRVRKRRPKQFPVMKKPRNILRKALRRKKPPA